MTVSTMHHIFYAFCFCFSSICNDIFRTDCQYILCWQVIDKSFGFDTAVEEAQRAIHAAHVESESVENGVGVVKLMGRYSGRLQFLIMIPLYKHVFHVNS